MKHWVVAITFLLPLFCLSGARANPEAEVTLPLRGFFHPGRYMPLHVVATTSQSGEQQLRVDAGGSMSVVCPMNNGSADVLMPWICYSDQMGAVSVTIDGVEVPRPTTMPPVEVRALTAEQRLVGYATGDAQEAVALGRALSADRECIACPLPPGQALAGSPAAWETLDLLILDRAAAMMQSLPSLTQSLVPMGVALAIRDSQAGEGNASPDPQWPWRHITVGEVGYWVLLYTAVGPDGTYSPDVYRVVDHWQPRWPTSYRRQALLIAVVYSLCLLGGLLLRPRGIVWIVVLTSVAIGVAELWRRTHWPVTARGGDVLLMPAGASSNPDIAQTPGLVQIDSWSFHAALATSFIDCRWAGLTKPIFYSEQQMSRFSPILYCAQDGQPHTFHFTMTPGEKLALLMRSAGPRPPNVTPSVPVTSALEPLVRMIYLREGDEIAGQFQANPSATMGWEEEELWPAMVVQRGATKPSGE